MPDVAMTRVSVRGALAGGGIAGAALSCFHVFSTILDLSSVGVFIVENWEFATQQFWLLFAWIFSWPKIGSVDAIFLSFLAFVLVTALSSLRRGREIQDDDYAVLDFLAAFIGFCALLSIFALGDVATFDASADLSSARIQRAIYDWYFSVFHVSDALVLLMPTDAARILNWIIFYALIGLCVMGAALGGAYLAGYAAQPRALAIRIWLTVLGTLAIVGVDHAIGLISAA